MSSMMPLGNNSPAVAPLQVASSRGLPANPAQGRRLQANLANMPLPPPPPPPIPEKFHTSGSSSLSSLSASGPISASQVISLAREAMNRALEDNAKQAGQASGVSTEIKPGVTIDLSRKNIQELPEEVVDIIKNELERLALSHNKLSSFPVRFSECTSLRYLNVRNNHMREFPLPLCDLKSLEILDLGRNKIRILPPEIAKLASLKVLAVQKNRIEELPFCLADMMSLQVLKLDGNSITFPPREVLQVQASSPPNEGFLKENELHEVTATAYIKKFLKHKALELTEQQRIAGPEAGGDDTSDGTETPRLPIKRVVSGRFPIKVNGVDADLRSPNLARPPPIPSRSHARGLSQQNTAVRRPGVLPLAIGNPNERLRSNSETLLAASRTERPSERQRRMGLMSRKANELGTLDETQANNRFSHYRGLSHGSSMTGNPAASVSPNSPAEPLLQRPNYVRRLSVLPEQRRESKIFDPIIESAKGILYAIFQIHPIIQLVTRLTNDGTPKRSSLEIVFYNTNVHVEELELEIQRHEESMDHDRHVPRENESVQRAVMTLISAYSHICTSLMNNMDVIVSNGDPRYIRTMMMCLFNSIMELRVTANEASVGVGVLKQPQPPRRPGIEDTLKPHSRENSVTPTADRPGLGGRSRQGTFTHNPSNLRVATDVGMPFINGSGRTATITSATPRSGESFASSSTEGRYAADVAADERLFEKIFLSLSKSTELVMRTLPNFNAQFNGGLRNAKAHRAPDHVLHCWKALIARCTHSISQTEYLKSRLSAIKFKEPGARTDAGFWTLCKSFIDAWAEYGNMLRYSMDQIHLPLDIRTRLRPVQLAIKETTQHIMSSPWAALFRQAGHPSESTHYYSPSNYPGNNGSSQLQLPMTPQSAALGPAVQATVPSTPQSASFANSFTGNVFERADALISMGGLSMSRTNTMNSTNTFNSNSVSSMSSMADDRLNPSSMLSPNGDVGITSYRRNGGGKPAF